MSAPSRLPAARWSLLLSAAALLAALATGCRGVAPRPTPADATRALWITRWDFLEPFELIALIDGAAEAGFDKVMLQVRGNGTVFYDSAYEPWAEELNGADPGWDPLGVAVDRAHARGIELHAWMNVMPAWRGIDPPLDPRQLWNARPGWLWYDQEGRRQDLTRESYVSVNPCMPEVREYLVNVLSEVAALYDVDGVHLDYVRFINEPPAVPRGSDRDYPRDARTLALYRADTGLAPDDDPAAWHQWRTDQVTQLVRRLRARLRRMAPRVELSAAVGPLPDEAMGQMQDWRRWLDEGLLDAIYPMNYAADPGVFEERAARWAGLARTHRVVMGVMAHEGPLPLRAQQIERAAELCGGVAVFAAFSFWGDTNDVLTVQDEDARAERAARRAALLPVIGRLAGR